MELGLVVGRLRSVEHRIFQIAIRFLPDLHLYEDYRAVADVLWSIARKASFLCLAAGRLAKTAALITKVASALKNKNKSKNKNKNTSESKNKSTFVAPAVPVTPVEPHAPETFSFFPHVPPEVQDMIWTAAAQPPPCTHYFSNFECTRGGGREPATQFMDDRGLWEACKGSRRVIKRAYEKTSADLTRVDASCQEDKRAIEMQRRRLGRYNKSGERFKRQLHEPNREMKVAFQCVGQLLDSFLSNSKHPSLATLTKEAFGMGPGWKLGDEEVPVEMLEGVCADLKGEQLS